MASASEEIAVGPQEICNQVNKFLKGTSTPASNVNFESLTVSALFLLRTVPVARHAVLEHYSFLFDDAINSSLTFSDHESSSYQKQQLSALQDVTGVLLSFIKSSPEAWAPVVSSWTLTLLGQLSTKYAAKRGIQRGTPLNEVLQMWLACEPARMLIEISTECFAAMVGAAPDMCVDSLLEASVRFSPHFDWVVAHIGSCFPRTIITRVLNCGLKDYCNDSGHDKEAGPSTNRLKVPKMASVVGILGHLASKHGHDIRKALMALFEASLHSDTMSNKVTTLPFLLQLASMSDMLLQILTTDLVSVLTPSTLNQLHRQFTYWKRSSPGEYNSFLNLVVHLIVKSRVGACDIISFILNTAVPAEDGKGGEQPTEEVRDTCVEIMHILMFELQRGVLSSHSDVSIIEIPFLVGLASQTDILTNMLLNAEGRRLPWLQKLLTYTSLQAGQSCAASILSSIVCNAQTPQQLSNFYSLKQGIELGLPSVIQPTVLQVFNRLEALASPSVECLPTPAKVSRLSPKAVSEETPAASASLPSSAHPPQLIPLRNLERIVAAEKRKIKKKQIASSRLVKELQSRQNSLVPFLLFPEPEVLRCVLSLVHMIGFPDSLGSALLTKLAGAVAAVFFNSLHLKASIESSSKDKLQEQHDVKSSSKSSLKEAVCDKGQGSSRQASCITRLCMSCIEQLSCLPFTRSLLLHYLMEGATHKEHCRLFGGKWTTNLFESPTSASSLSSLPSSNLSTNPEGPATSSSSSVVNSETSSLLQENRQQGNSIALPRFHSSVYHGGVIRQISKVSSMQKPLPKMQVAANVLTLLETLWLCCREGAQASSRTSHPQWGAPASAAGAAADVKIELMDTDLRIKPGKKVVSESSARTLGCVIVDILTLDSLYNDVNWQDPDFRKVTTERDILVWKRISDMPFLWSVLQEFSSSSVFLYYVSPVVRSLFAVVMNHLEVSREARMRNCPQHNEAACCLVYCLAQGSWIPSPLSNISELFPHVAPYEGYLLLLALWRYIKVKRMTILFLRILYNL
ncbi:integrator complex subunit 5 [Plakobranchus ocellatus]|uniref:Integrator complex subunit 5 n=1 Tax=Plakobranchus ocellatus TaxID=259542 RepID=A0AAV3Y7K9_9GAST|nr:integrator complex subunit 5 [Plakobranchus ocellatus]